MSLVLMRNGSWRWMIATTLAALLSAISLLTVQSSPSAAGTTDAAASTASSSSPLAALADEHPGRQVEVIVQLRPGTDPATGRSLVQAAGGTIERDLPIINGFGTTLPAEDAQRLSLNEAVHAVSLNARVESMSVGTTFDPATLATSYNQSIRSPNVWQERITGKGVGVAVIDTGIDGSLPDFQVSRANPASRVIASAIVNPGASNAGDSLGHGTHIAGLIAGDGRNRPVDDPLHGRYVGVAPDANLISVKAADENGDASVLDVIDGLQFVVDFKSDYNIRIVNLSLKSTQPESYKTDPLDAAVEAAWNSGIVVVAAAGNSGADKDAVSYAPGNDPFIITVGGVDDQGTKAIHDDTLASWSSRGLTQDGFAKPDILAPGAKLVSTMSAKAQYPQLCPSCVTDGAYFRVGGTSMAAAVASGEAALMLEADPTLTPNEVKSQMLRRTRPVTESESSGVLVDATGDPVPPRDDARWKTAVGAEAAADKAVEKSLVRRDVNTGLVPNLLLDPATGLIDYTRASWSRASWSTAAEGLRASWSRASWSRASWSRASWSATPEACADLERASWSRASWSRASWSRASWSRASWSADGMSTPDLPPEELAAIDAEIAAAQAECSALLGQIDPTRASWSRASWSRASWSTSFTK